MDLRPRIVVVGGDEPVRNEIAAALERGGFSDVVCHARVSALALDAAQLATPAAKQPTQSAAAVQLAVPTAKQPTQSAAAVPDLLVVSDAAACEQARAIPALEDVPILAVPRPGHSAAVLAAEADDVVEDSLDVPVMATRARRLIAMAQTRRKAQLVESLQDAMLSIHNLSASDDGDSPEVLRQALLVAVTAMQYDRASLIAHVDGSDTAYVIAATDDPSLRQFVISMDNYPELRAAVAGGRPVLIADACSDPLTAAVAHTLADKKIRGVSVFPVIWKGSSLGALLFRRQRPGIEHLDKHRMAFGLMFAKHAAARLHHGKVVESLREQTHRISRARYEAERRLRTIDSLKEHFEAAADGVIVLEQSGRVVFVNQTAERITGFARHGLVGQDISVLVADAQCALIRQVVDQVLRDQNVDAFDLQVHTTSGEPICVSVTTSTVLSQSGAAILSFRDVTAQRALESELRKTKEFLERLIDSAVDAIVAADLRGNIIVYNQGAERLFGYTAEEVIGRVPVWDLYAPGVPRRVMQTLRSTQYGGVGRIELTRREIINKNRERVPVNMTASIVYEEGREVATVGIFSDLRALIRIEQRLLQAQQRLEMTKERAVLAELAGTAAHELNQPLQSITGYTELLVRQSEPDAPHRRAVDIIMREAERMAEIVRRIGKITRYETMPYPGGTRIFDIHTSSKSGSDRAIMLPSGDIGEERALDAGPEGTVEEEFDDAHQITVARVELSDVLLQSEAMPEPLPAGPDHGPGAGQQPVADAAPAQPEADAASGSAPGATVGPAPAAEAAGNDGEAGSSR